MRRVYVDAHSIVAPIGIGTQEVFERLLQGVSGVQEHTRPEINEQPIWSALMSASQQATILSSLNSDGSSYSRFEQLAITAINKAFEEANCSLSSQRSLLVLATTKGNISLLEQEPYGEQLQQRLQLMHSAKVIAKHFGHPNQPVVVSNACISGVQAIIYAKRLLTAGKYDTAVVVGADLISRFVLSGFQSFNALASGLCRPFSVDRDGINLGEAAACMVLTTDKRAVEVRGGAISNDANHISGPSRTGQELSMAIEKAIGESGIRKEEIGLLSAHGTATLFNDEMEAKAFQLSGLQNVPTNSLKGYFGHTLGAAGVLESVVSIASMQQGVVLPTRGFTTLGVTESVNVIDKLRHRTIQHCLKTASGFGGCNAALILSNN